MLDGNGKGEFEATTRKIAGVETGAGAASRRAAHELASCASPGYKSDGSARVIASLTCKLTQGFRCR